jgi:CRISPR-associated protein Csb3
MSEAVIPVDLFNPGQVFASLGFLEAADVLLGDEPPDSFARGSSARRFYR